MSVSQPASKDFERASSVIIQPTQRSSALNTSFRQERGWVVFNQPTNELDSHSFMCSLKQPTNQSNRQPAGISFIHAFTHSLSHFGASNRICSISADSIKRQNQRAMCHSRPNTARMLDASLWAAQKQNKSSMFKNSLLF